MHYPDNHKRSLHRLGEIFLEAGIISPEVFSLGIMMAKQAEMPIGRALVMAESISELDLECALEVQSAIREGTIEAKIAKELLRFAHDHQVTINEAYRLHGLSRRLGPLPRTAKLILAAGIVSENGIQAGLRSSQKSGLPIGRTLVNLRLLNQSTLEVCLNLQILIRDGRLSFLQAVRALQSIHNDKVSFNDALKSSAIVCTDHLRPKLGELLVTAGILTLEDSIVICELGIECDRPFGCLLIEHNLVSPTVLDAAIQVQTMFGMPGFTKLRAIRLLVVINETGESLEKLVAEFDFLDQVIAILLAAQVIDEDLVIDTIASIRNFELTEAEALIYRGLINADIFNAAAKLIERIQRGSISFEKALEVLQELNHSREQTIFYPRDVLSSLAAPEAYHFKKRSVKSELGRGR